MKVVTWSLQMLERPVAPARPFPAGARLERATGIGPEYARFLYGLVGGPWRWTDRLHWNREEWAEELAVPGTEFHVLYAEGVPRGYVHLHPQPGSGGGTDVEIRYFGLVEEALGRGFGGRLLEHGIQAAWTLPERFDLPAVTRVWVHTCSLDGPAALANYQARGLVVYKTEETEERVPEEPLGAWCSTGGPVPG